MQKIRLDNLLVEQGFYPNRSRASAAVIAGEVRVEGLDQKTLKPGAQLKPDIKIEVVKRRLYVSRGGIKLHNALEASGIQVADRTAVDVGASTGGFTDCLLQRGASSVAAVDVGYGQLDGSLSQDPRVTVIDRCNARELTPELLPFQPNLAVIDVSFISLKKVLPAVLNCMAESFECLAMLKPQFEVGRQRLGKGGVVRNQEHRREAVTEVANFAVELGFSCCGFYPSGLPGPKGNRETFIHLADSSHQGLVEIESAAELIDL